MTLLGEKVSYEIDRFSRETSVNSHLSTTCRQTQSETRYFPQKPAETKTRAKKRGSTGLRAIGWVQRPDPDEG